MEEDIKNLSEIIELCEEKINNNDENVSAILDLTDLKSLRNLIKEYKNLKEIEENHRKENGKLRERVKELEEENQLLLNSKIGVDLSFDDYIPVSLVEETIGELNKAYEDSKDENGESEYYYPDYTIRVLEELLEKRK